VRILVVDDDTPTRKMLRFVLEQVGGHTVAEADGAGAGERALNDGRFDLITLDVMMPDGDGLQLCQRIRRVSDVPIVMLSAKSNIPDRVQGLKIGADDYIGKPFDPSELLARVEALARRARQASIREDDTRIRVGDLVLDLAEHSVAIRGRTPVPLTKTEFRLLLELARAAGEIRTREELEVAIWGAGAGASPNTIDSYISDLRRKVEPDPTRPRYVLTIRGRGYRLAR
jgi:DNA-binding response OmpR family regulator